MKIIVLSLAGIELLQGYIVVFWDIPNGPIPSHPKLLYPEKEFSLILYFGLLSGFHMSELNAL